MRGRFACHIVALAAVLVAGLTLPTAPTSYAVSLFDVGPAGNEAALVTMNRLPAWVQIASGTARLYARDNGPSVAAPNLTRNTFLRVIAGGSSRLQVEAFDANGQPGQRGWVDAGDVLPSAAGTGWLVSAAATPLFRTADPLSETQRSLDRFTPLEQLDGPVQGRVMVRVYRPDLSGAVDQGWVDLSATGPALPPQLRVAPPTDRTLSLRALGQPNQQTFIASAAAAAQAGAARTGVPASVTVAQAILESDWGRSTLAQNANNYFGLKATSSLGSDGVVWMPTSEYDDAGNLYQTVSPFRAYKSLADSLADHDRLLQTAGRYAEAMQAAHDPKQFAARLYEAGYSTDPSYADKLIALMDTYDLYRLDS